MFVTLDEVTYPLHWNDRFYEATCPKCGAEIWEKTPDLVSLAIDEHNSGTLFH